MIGAGPANLAAARYLLIKGCTVTIYDRLESAGGAILSGIPSYRFDKQYLADIQRELTDAGAVFHFSTEVGKDISFDEILQSYDRVLISCGAQIEGKNGLDGDGCEAGLSLLYQLNILNKQNEYKEKYHSALVWGGGNVAMDCARSLKRILNDVTVIYRRSEKEMPAAADEIEAAKQEGVHFAFLENIKELHHDAEGKVTGAHCIKMHLGEPDASGRARPIETEGSDYDIPCELVVPAIGQKVSFTAFDNIEKTDTHLSSAKHVYISGDAYLNPSTVAAAIKDGCDAAAEIDASFH
jgi:NADPH-dependent glutamate synthase beta subunit-like oxidoreductase